MLAPSWSLAVASRMAEVDPSLSCPLPLWQKLNLTARWRFAQQLRFRNITAFVLPNSFKSALIPAMAGIPRRIGWKGERRRKVLTIFRVAPLSDSHEWPIATWRWHFLHQFGVVCQSLPGADAPGIDHDTGNQSALIDRYRLDLHVLLGCAPVPRFGPAGSGR